MSNSALKLIAIIAMLIDHIGAVFFPYEITFRIIGRIAFPIFCFLLVQGYEKTSNLKRYFTRLGIFALVSQVPFYLAFYYGSNNDYGLNVFFTLFVGLFLLQVIDSDKYSYGMKIILVLMSMIITTLLSTDYSWFGIITILIFKFTQGRFKYTALGLLVLNILYCNIEYIVAFGFLNVHINLWMIVEMFSLLALIPIYFYNGKRGTLNKWISYTFYPLHLLIIFFISNYIIS